jgi:hypothetical protein
MLRDLMRDKGNTMPIDPQAAEITALRVWHCNYLSLTRLTQFSNLRTLVVATYPDVDLQPLAALASLEYLSLVHLPNVDDLTPLAQLKQLRTVRLATLPSWDSSGKVTVVESLRPLAALPNLIHLELFGVQPAGKSLFELEKATALASVRVSKYPEPEVARFYKATGVSDAWAPSPSVADWN